MISYFSLSEPERSTKSSVEMISLLQLRWGAIICQVLLILLIAFTLSETIPYLIVTTIILFETASNLFFQYRRGKQFTLPIWLFFGVMVVDIILLTVLLSETGGVMNPFSFLYLLHIVIGAILLPSKWAWALTILTNVSYSCLYFPPFNTLSSQFDTRGGIQTVCVDVLNSTLTNQSKMDLHLKGMLVAFALTSLFIVYFIGKIGQALARHNSTLQQLKEEKSRSEQLASLATLAAGTAHELATPLSTIKLVTGEMLHSMQHTPASEEIMDDLHLVRDQIKRCEEVLYQMSEDAGEHRGEQWQLFSIDELLAEAIAIVPKGNNRVVVTNESEGFTLYAPHQTMKRTIKSLLKNAIDADPLSESPIQLKCRTNQDFLFIIVTDLGPGMNPETAIKATEPFFTTKSPGAGMGLGLFLAQSVAERFGGDLTIVSNLGEGTTVEISFSKQLIRRGNNGKHSSGG